MAKILIVDDSALSRRLLRRILESAGHAVIEAADGVAALESYFLARPDLVLLDLTMTGMYGLDVLSKLRELDPAARVVIASADIQSFTRELALQGDARDFINKPFVADQVLPIIAAALAPGTGERP
jgi:two-component system chemotaxis response regulator CheY